jgi:hypothetical protein
MEVAAIVFVSRTGSRNVFTSVKKPRSVREGGVRRTGSVNRAFVPGVCPVYAPARKAQGRARTDRAGRRGNGGVVFGDQRTGDAVVYAGARDVVWTIWTQVMAPALIAA